MELIQHPEKTVNIKTEPLPLHLLKHTYLAKYSFVYYNHNENNSLCVKGEHIISCHYQYSERAKIKKQVLSEKTWWYKKYKTVETVVTQTHYGIVILKTNWSDSNGITQKELYDNQKVFIESEVSKLVENFIKINKESLYAEPINSLEAKLLNEYTLQFKELSELQIQAYTALQAIQMDTYNESLKS